MLISEPNFDSLRVWFLNSQYSIMGIYLTSGDPDEKKILSSIADNWQEIDNLSGSSLCFIYFDSSICKSYRQFISWVREVRSFNKYNLRQVADDSFLFSKKICEELGILNCNLPSLILLGRYNSTHIIIPVSSYLEIQTILNIVRILSSFTQDRDTIFTEVHNLEHVMTSSMEMYHQNKRALIEKMNYEKQQLIVTESHLSENVFHDNDIYLKTIPLIHELYKKYWEEIRSYKLENDDFCKKSFWAMMTYLKKRNDKPSESLLKAFNQLQKNITALARKAHVQPNTIYCEIEKGDNNLKAIISDSLLSYHSLLSSKKDTLNESLLKNAEKLKTLEESSSVEQEEYSKKLEIAKKDANNKLSAIINSYCKIIQAKTGLTTGVCESLLQELSSSTLFLTLKDILKKTKNLTLPESPTNSSAISAAVRNADFNVFISCKSEDYGKAREIFDFLVKNGFHPFLADISLDQIHMDEYNIVIREAIDMCPSMIVLASEPEYVNAHYVSYEWNLYVNEKAAGRKTGNLIPIIKKISDIPKLPIALRACQACTIDNYQNHLLPYLSEKN